MKKFFEELVQDINGGIDFNEYEFKYGKWECLAVLNKINSIFPYGEVHIIGQTEGYTFNYNFKALDIVEMPYKDFQKRLNEVIYYGALEYQE